MAAKWGGKSFATEESMQKYTHFDANVMMSHDRKRAQKLDQIKPDQQGIP